MNKTVTFPVDDNNVFKIQMLNWVNRFNIFCLLDNQQYNFDKPAFECLLAAGCRANIEMQAGKAFESLQKFYNAHPTDWLFGHFGYGLNNEDELLPSQHTKDETGFADLHFFVPEIVIELARGSVNILYDGNAKQIFEDIRSCPAVIQEIENPALHIRQRIKKEEYLQLIKKLQQHIVRGDCYEINFCQEFFAD